MPSKPFTNKRDTRDNEAEIRPSDMTDMRHEIIMQQRIFSMRLSS